MFRNFVGYIPLILFFTTNIFFNVQCLDEQYFNIAGVTPSSGKYQPNMQYAKMGYTFFCDQLNRKGGFQIKQINDTILTNEHGEVVNFKFNCTIEDDESQLETHLEKFGVFVEDSDIDFLVGGHPEFEWQTVKTYMNSTQKILAECCNGEVLFYEMDYKNVFGISVTNEWYPKNTIKKFALSDIFEIAMLYEADNPFRKSTCESALREAEDRQINVTVLSTYDTRNNSTEYVQEQIDNFAFAVKETGVRAIVSCISTPNAITLTYKIHELQIPLEAFFITSAPWQAPFREAVGNLSQYVISAGQWHAGRKTEDDFFGSNNNYKILFEKEFGMETYYIGAMASATMQIYMYAIQAAFVRCDVSATNGSVPALLYGEGVVFCDGKERKGYDLVYESMNRINKRLFYGAVQFNRFRQNIAMSPVTVQILPKRPGSKELVVKCVLPEGEAEDKLIMPSPNRYFSGCPSGYMLTSRDLFEDCVPCPSGMRRCATCSQLSCEYCARNEYNNNTGQEECLQCPENTEAVVNGATYVEQCQCRPDYYHPYYEVGKPCEECPEGAVCPGHNKQIYPKPGYWISQQIPHSLYPCVRTDVCLGTEANLCKIGYQGPLCTVCQQGYHYVLKECKRCPNRHILVIYVICVVIFWWILNSVIVRYIDMFSIIINWLQLLRVVGLFAVNWPIKIFSILSVTALFAYEVDVIELTCLYENWSFTHNFIIQLLMPIAVAVICAFTYLCSYLYFRKTLNKQSKAEDSVNSQVMKFIQYFIVFPRSYEELGSALNLSIATFLSFLNGSLLAIAEYSFDSFSCVKIGGQEVLKNRYEVQCGGRQHLIIKVLGVISLVLYVISYPVYMFWSSMQVKRTKSFHWRTKLERLGWFYGKYEVEWFWYELTHIGHKIVFVAIFFFVHSPSMQCIAAAFITIALLLLHIYSRPYVDVALDILQTILMIALLLVILSGLIFYNPIIESEDRKIVEIYVLVTLVVFGFTLLVFLFRDLLEKSVRQLASWVIAKSQGLGGEEALELKQVLRVFNLKFLLHWLWRSDKQEHQEMLLLCKELQSYVSNESDTSYLSITKVGRWWRDLSQRFPEVVDFLAIVDPQSKQNFIVFVDVLYRDFYRLKGQENIYDMISWQDRAPVAQWLTVTDQENRNLFNEVTLLAFSMAKGHHIARQIKLRIASNGKGFRQLQKLKKKSSTPNASQKSLFSSQKSLAQESRKSIQSDSLENRPTQVMSQVINTILCNNLMQQNTESQQEAQKQTNNFAQQAFRQTHKASSSAKSLKRNSTKQVANLAHTSSGNLASFVDYMQEERSPFEHARKFSDNQSVYFSPAESANLADLGIKQVESQNLSGAISDTYLPMSTTNFEQQQQVQEQESRSNGIREEATDPDPDRNLLNEIQRYMSNNVELRMSHRRHNSDEQIWKK